MPFVLHFVHFVLYQIHLKGPFPLNGSEASLSICEHVYTHETCKRDRCSHMGTGKTSIFYVLGVIMLTTKSYS